MTISKSELQALAVELFNVGVIKLGRIPSTPIYMDFKQLIYHPQLLGRLSMMLWSLADSGEKYDKICGVPYVATTRCGVAYTAITYAYQISSRIDIAMMLMHRSSTIATNVNAARTSRSPQQPIQGEFEAGDRVVIVDDEIDNGSNVLEVALDLVKQGLKVGEALVVVDHEQAGVENLENAGVRVKSLFGITELIGYLKCAGKMPSAQERDIIARKQREQTNIINDRRRIYAKTMQRQPSAYVNNETARNTRRRGFV